MRWRWQLLKYRLGVWLLMNHLLDDPMRKRPPNLNVTRSSTSCERRGWKFTAEITKPAPCTCTELWANGGGVCAQHGRVC